MGSKDMAGHLKKFWTEVMAGSDVTEDHILQYLESLPIPQQVRNAFPLLYKPLSLDLVIAAGEDLRTNSSPGLDGIPAEVYQKWIGLFAP